MTPFSNQIILLAIGSVFLAFSCLEIHRGATASKIWPMLLFPTVLILSAIWSPRIHSVHAGPDGLTLDLLQEAGIQVVQKYPALAESITKLKGPNAVKKLVSAIREAKSEDDIKKVLPFQAQSDDLILFSENGYGQGGFGESGYGVTKTSKMVYPVKIESGVPKVQTPQIENVNHDYSRTKEHTFSYQ